MGGRSNLICDTLVTDKVSLNSMGGRSKAIVDTEPAAAVQTNVNDFTHDESSSMPELASDVNKVVCPPSSPTIESDK
ncbi:hypothetical protein Tco_0065353 [Tanacetum coccineum]